MKRQRMSFSTWIFSFVLLWYLLLCDYSFAQYKVHSWVNFEEGAIPSNMQMRHLADSSNVSIYAINSPDAPAGMLNETSIKECGKYCLRFTPNKNGTDKFLSIVDSKVLDRSQLGENGLALFQADFYITQSPTELPYSMAVLAMFPDDSGDIKNIWKMYRAGFIKGDKVFFSYAFSEPGEKDGKPKLTAQTKPLVSLSRPGWHRLQMVFQGQTKIFCMVDGVPAPWSGQSSQEINEATIKTFKVGLMVTGDAGVTTPCYIDNLSIQFSPEDVPLPDSPWVKNSNLKLSVANPFTNQAEVLNENKKDLNWHQDPNEAWQFSKQQNKPLLVLFYAPKVQMFQEFQNIIQTDINAQTLLSKYTLTLIDVNQLSGGIYAEKFMIYKVPCFLVLDKSGKEAHKVIMSKENKWQSIAQSLENTLAGIK